MHVFVVHLDNPVYAKYTFPFIKDYCRRCGYLLTVCFEPPSDQLTPQWQKLLDHELAQNQRVLILDLNVAPQPYAPPIHAMVGQDRIAMIAEWPQKHLREFIHRLGFPENGVMYSGFVGSPVSDYGLSAEINKMGPVSDAGDQAHTNLAVAKGISDVAPLDGRWNHGVRKAFSPVGHSHLFWFAHFEGCSERRQRKSRALWQYWYGRPSKRGRVRILYDLLTGMTQVPQAGIEVGVAEGALSAAILGAFPSLTLTMIDSWQTYPRDHPYRLTGDGRAKLTQRLQIEARNLAVERTAFAGSRANVLQMESGEAAQQITDDSQDFVFIDGDHTYNGCRRDIEAYFSKVRSGGLLAGDDYGHRRFTGVKCAVDEFAKRHRLKLRIDEQVWSTEKP